MTRPVVGDLWSDAGKLFMIVSASSRGAYSNGWWEPMVVGYNIIWFYSGNTRRDWLPASRFTVPDVCRIE